MVVIADRLPKSEIQANANLGMEGEMEIVGNAFKRIDLGRAEGDAKAPAVGIAQPHPILPEKVADGRPGASAPARTVPLRSGSSAPVATLAPSAADKASGASAIELRAKPETNSPRAAAPPAPAPPRSLRRLAIPLSP